MSFVLRQKVINEIEAEPVHDSNIGVALREANAKAGESGLVAPMYLQLENFPYADWTTANGEIVSGVGTFNNERAAYVVTFHGGIGDVGAVIPPDKIIQALKLYNEDKGGLNDVYAVVLDDVHEGNGNEVFQELLDGKLGTLFTPEQVASGEAQQHVDGFKKFGIVRPLSDYRAASSGYSELSVLIKGDVRQINDLDYKDWSVTHPEVLDWSASPERAKNTVRRAKAKFTSGKWGVWHIFNNNGFSADQAQARVPALGGSDYGDCNGLGGYFSIYDVGRFPVVAPEALRSRESFSGQPNGHPYRDAPVTHRSPSLDARVQGALDAGKGFEYNGRLFVPVDADNVILK